MRPTRRMGLPLLALLLGSGWVWISGRGPDRFDHREHAKLFPTCTTCHAGAARQGQPMFPEAITCTNCHDGVGEDSVTWTGATPVPSNLAFDHVQHQEKGASPPIDRTASTRCADCHSVADSTRMVIHRTNAGQCLDCHTLEGNHFGAPDSACATCHLTLVQAAALSDSAIGAFPTPPNHEDSSFVEASGHGGLASGGGSEPVAPSCATCHARDFCISCHVDAPEQETIQALPLDPRSLAIKATLREPATHAPDRFPLDHGKDARQRTASCATCHTQESCTACHLPPSTRIVGTLPRAGAGRAAGAPVVREPPASHGSQFAGEHGIPASSAPTQCLTCHTRNQCLACHLPDAAGTTGFHPAAFLTRHPTDAYRREASCADCHNTGQFCASCHQQAGLTTRATLGNARFHDAKRFFIAGHGPAARQSLESCVGCHVERDCLTCHSAVGGRRFNPHGPGFDPERLRRRNPEMCAACHGATIPPTP